MNARQRRKLRRAGGADSPQSATSPLLGTLGSSPSSSVSDRKLAANQANAQLSTGPRTEEGKAVSSRNHFRHGLTGAFCVLDSESKEDFEQFKADLISEHQPETPTEILLVNDMARHYWLLQRALRLQEECFAAGIEDQQNEKRLALYLRYATTNQRAFHRCLQDLLKLRAERLRQARGFESQQRQAAAELRREAREQRAAELHSLNVALRSFEVAAAEMKLEPLVGAELSASSPQYLESQP